MKKKHKILIANRGEIAVRIMEMCKELGHDFISVYTQEDIESGHISVARELGGEESLCKISNYNDAGDIFAVADHKGATAIHPGYGFFSESYRFARRVTTRTRPMIFIGPSWQVIQELGDKINTKRLARTLNIPTVPGSDRAIYDELEAETIARSLFEFQKEMGIPQPVILIKASAGGGGMGIDEVYDLDHFRQTYRNIRNYSLRTFHDAGVLIEQRIFNFNHLEVQVISNSAGTEHVHFGTRNCSIQSPGRQKRIEIAPGFFPEKINYTFDAQKVLDDIIEYSLRMAKEINYNNAGTWEWIVTPQGNPFLMEVNTRIQVENGVSAAISKIKGERNVNLIREQIRLALGDDMGYTQEDISFEGVGIEYRIIAEDTVNKFTPWVGKITDIKWEKQDWLKIHTHIPQDREYQIPTEYDPNLALAIILGDDLEDAKKKGFEFLDNFTLEGIDHHNDTMCSNKDFLREKTHNLLEF